MTFCGTVVLESVNSTMTCVGWLAVADCRPGPLTWQVWEANCWRGREGTLQVYHLLVCTHVGHVKLVLCLVLCLSWQSPLLQSAQLPSSSAVVYWIVAVSVAWHSLSPGCQSVAPDSEQDMRK